MRRLVELNSFGCQSIQQQTSRKASLASRTFNVLSCFKYLAFIIEAFLKPQTKHRTPEEPWPLKTTSVAHTLRLLEHPPLFTARSEGVSAAMGIGALLLEVCGPTTKSLRNVFAALRCSQALCLASAHSRYSVDLIEVINTGDDEHINVMRLFIYPNPLPPFFRPGAVGSPNHITWIQTLQHHPRRSAAVQRTQTFHPSKYPNLSLSSLGSNCCPAKLQECAEMIALKPT